MSPTTDRKKLSFVLPVAISDTGRPGNDLGRMNLLLESFTRCFPREHLATFLVVTKPHEMALVSAALAASGASEFAEVVSETQICPELAADPDTFHEFPERNKGWYRQQLLKLGAATHVGSPFYMTLDSDVIFTNEFHPDDVIHDGRSVINVQTAEDFHALFADQTAEASVRIRTGRDRRAEELLGVTRSGTCFYGETPVVLSVDLVGRLLEHLESRHRAGWCTTLISNLDWTEYSLYFTFAEGRGLLDTFHVRGGFDSVLRMSDSLWYPASDYRTPRSIDNWTWTAAPRRDGVSVVVQSYLGYEIDTVRKKVSHLLRVP